jgi:hypothetical protein
MCSQTAENPRRHADPNGGMTAVRLAREPAFFYFGARSTRAELAAAPASRWPSMIRH